VRKYWLNWFKKFAKYSVDLGASRLGSHIGILSVDDNKSKRIEFQDRCIEMWKELSNFASEIGLKELTWEHMSIEREQGHTCEDINYLIDGLKDSKVPIKICLDPDHGDLTSNDRNDYEPYHLLKTYLPHSLQLHLKQTSLDKRKNGPFTKKNNLNGLIKGEKVADLLTKYVSEENKKNFEVILELNSREREPDDSQIIEDIEESLIYWRNIFKDNNIKYE
jgi:sugar phosphate isomerase/epimerase